VNRSSEGNKSLVSLKYLSFNLISSASPLEFLLEPDQPIKERKGCTTANQKTALSYLGKI